MMGHLTGDALGVCGHEIVDIQTVARVVMPERGFLVYKLKDLGAARNITGSGWLRYRGNTVRIRWS